MYHDLAAIISVKKEFLDKFIEFLAYGVVYPIMSATQNSIITFSLKFTKNYINNIIY